MRQIKVKEYGVLPGTRERENTWRAQGLLDELRGTEEAELVFEAG